MSGTSTALSVSADSGTHWIEPGAWRCAPGVLRVPLPLPMDGLRAVNVYVIEGDDGLTLVDGGWAIEVSRTLLESSLAGAGHDLRDIRRFLVTHVHRDHYTQAVTVRREFGAHVSLGLGDKPTLDLIHAADAAERGVGGADAPEDPYLEILRQAGAHDLAQEWERFTADAALDVSLWDYPDTWLEGDCQVAAGERTLDAVATPGHTQGHYVFADRAAGLLFAGDHVLPTITPSIGFEPRIATDPLGDFLGSLQRVRDLPDLRLLPAHGPVADSSHARVDELLAHHDARLALCRGALADHDQTATTAASYLPWTRHEHTLDELDPFNRALAVLETRAHLELLVRRGEVTRRDTEDGWVYALA